MKEKETLCPVCDWEDDMENARTKRSDIKGIQQSILQGKLCSGNARGHGGRSQNEKLSAAEWYETYEEASQAAKDMFKGTAEELYRPDAGDILLAPSDYGSKRYCTNVDRGLKAEIIGFELLGKNGKMVITMSAEEK